MIDLRVILLLAVSGGVGFAQTRPGDSAAAAAELTCSDREPNLIDFTVQSPRQPQDCLRLDGGFAGDAGSFVRLSALAGDFLQTGGTFGVGLEQGERLRKVQAGFAKKLLFATPIEGGIAIYGQRFKYNQAQDSSLFAFQPDIPAFQNFPPDDLVRYVQHSYGVTLFARRRVGRFSSFGINYGFDVSDLRPLTAGTSDYFDSIAFTNASGPISLTGIKTSKVTPSLAYNTVNNPDQPTRGTALLISTALAGLGGNVRTVEPAVDLKLYYRGVRRRDVIAIHLHGSMITGYGGREVPPFDRYYEGGEDELRGFDSWSISPVAFLPASVSLDVLNPDGSQRTQTVILANGTLTTVPVTMLLPIYRFISPGGDTKVVTNVEYRIPLGGPFTLVIFDDAGVNRLTFVDQLRSLASQIAALNAEFPEANFADKAIALGATEKIRMSAGVELQFLLKRIHAPLRFYWAYNPLSVQEYLQPPVVFDPSFFPNYGTLQSAIAQYGTAIPLMERRNMFRFAIGRTF